MVGSVHAAQHCIQAIRLSMFNHYHLEHPSTHEVRVLDGRSYLLAGILGSFYTLWRTDLRTFATTLLVNAGFVLAALISILATPFMPGLLKLVGLVVIPVVLAVLQSRIIVRTVRRHFARQGWIVTRA